MSKNGIAPSISDDAVQNKTGKTWAEWFAYLDSVDGTDLTHKEIVAVLRNGTDLSGWWQQMVTVTYEQARGMREKHEKTDGYQVSASKTVAVPVAWLYRHWADGRQRKRWIREQITITRKTENTSLRVLWSDGKSRLDVMFYEKGDEKTQVTVNHSKISSATAAEAHKAQWRERLNGMKTILESQYAKE